MKRKFTPEVTLQMLKELKKLVDDKTFVAGDFKIKYPTYYNFRKFIFSKGLMVKKHGTEVWASIEPNIIMAKEILKLYIAYTRENNENYRNKVKEKKLQESRALKNPFNIDNNVVQKQENPYIILRDLTEMENCKSELNIKINETIDLRKKVSVLQQRIEDQVEILGTKNEKISFLENKIKILESKESKTSKPLVSNVNDTFIIPNAEFYRDSTSRERMSNIISTKTYKVFGITVFSIIKK